LKPLYTHKAKSVEFDGDKHVILTKWHDSTGQSQYDVSELNELLPKPSLSPGTITIYSNMVRLSISEMQPRHLVKARRGSVIPEFLGKKRKRMIDAVNSWRIPMKCVFFITLTYPKDYPKDWQVWKHDLKIYKEHLQREYPKTQGFWKLELQRRGAPHYHLVCEINEEVDLREFRNWNDQIWANIAHYLDRFAGEYACTVKKMHTIREALNYAAKYQTKETYAPVDDEGEILTAEKLGDSVGRLWGRIGKPDCSPSEKISVRREWALNSKATFASILRLAGQYKFADYLERQGAHNSFTLYGVGDTRQNDDKRGKEAFPPVNRMIHRILSQQRAYSAYETPKGNRRI